MKASTVHSPIGYCPICRQDLFGPNLVDHFIDNHPAVLVLPRSEVDEEINRRLREEYRYNGTKLTNS